VQIVLRKLLSTARGLSPDRRRLVLRAWVLLLAVDLGLRLLSFQRLVTLLGTGNPDPGAPVRCNSEALLPHPRPELAAVFHRAYWALDTVCRNYPCPVTCLRRSLVLQVLLKDCGITTELHLGVRKEGGTLEAHAWLEYEGCPVAEPETVRDRFKPMAPMPR